MTTETDIRKIAGVHLGRTAAGEIMTPYAAPKQHDPSLLVPMPREIGRRNSNITAPFTGYDVWHAYEFSYLRSSGQPQTGVLKFYFPCESPVMIESKSFKLYLNSFDFERFDSVDSVLNTIRKDLAPYIEYDFYVAFHEGRARAPNSTQLGWIGASVDDADIDNISFEENPDILKTLIPADRNKVALFHTANLRSACEITNQKDTGHCFIAMQGNHRFDLSELARYIFSLRDSQHFHENVTEIIYNTLYNRYKPADLFVLNAYNRRGGLDIHPARFTSDQFAANVFPNHWDVKYYLCLTNQV